MISITSSVGRHLLIFLLSRVKVNELIQHWSLGWSAWRLEFGGTTTRACSQVPVILPLLSLTILSVLLLVYLRKYGGPEAGTGIWINGEIIHSSRRNKEVFCSGLSVFLGGC